jgi:hypothetical protein
MTLITSLGGGSPERIASTLPPGFFDKPKPLGPGRLELADDLHFARQSGAEIVANIVPAATRLPNINALSDRARTPRPRPADKARPQTAPPLKAPTAVSVVDEPWSPPPPSPAQSPVPFLLPPESEADVEAAIAQASRTAERSAREANSAPVERQAPDYRALLPQGPLVAPPPLPLGPESQREPAGAPSEEGITTFALDAPPAKDRVRAAPDAGKAAAAARQQFFSLLTARLKATNQRLLAEAVRAGPRTTVRMKFLIDRSGRVLEISPAETATQELQERAARVIRAATLPPVPEAMTQVPLELSFPVEVYR